MMKIGLGVQQKLFVPVIVQWNFVPSGSRVTSSIVTFMSENVVMILAPPKSFATSKNPLLHICDLYDAALCLRVLWILHHRHVQLFFAFAECDICCAITRGDLKYV